VYCAAPRFGGKNVIRASGVEALHQSVAHFGEIGAAAEDHRAAAEACAGQARTDRAGCHRVLYQAVQGRATDLQAIAQAGVGFEQQAAEAIGGVLVHRLYRVAHAEGFCDDVQE